MTKEITSPEQLTEFVKDLEKVDGHLERIPTAMDRMEEDFNKQRQQWYGDNWKNVGWYGNRIVRSMFCGEK